MLGYLKSFFKKFARIARLFLEKFKLKPPANVNKNILLFIHIGKCGGGTLDTALATSPVVQKKFSRVRRVHTRKPPIRKHSKYPNHYYAIIVRDPIKRAISAFNWRYHIVVQTKRKPSAFPNEYEILKKYGNLNALCEQLYENGVLNRSVADEFENIQHLRENIAFYLKPLLDEIHPSQLFGVFATETLNEDIYNILGVKNEKHGKKNPVADDQKFLSREAYLNLERYLSDDYLYLSKLRTMYDTPSSKNKNY